MEVSELPIGLLINHKTSFTGIRADLATFLAIKNCRTEFLRKFDDHDDLADIGKNADRFTHLWAMLMDKRYTDVDSEL